MVRASREGYLPAAGAPSPIAGGWIYFRLSPPAPPPNLTGEYEFTFVADPACSELPGPLRTRTYRGRLAIGSAGESPGLIAPIGTFFTLTLDGTAIVNNGASAVGVAGNFAAFELFNDGFPYILEQLAPDRWLAITGYAESVITQPWSDKLSIPFDGWVDYLGHYPSHPGTPIVSCRSTHHRLIIADH
jgi:hypothetical protein